MWLCSDGVMLTEIRQIEKSEGYFEKPNLTIREKMDKLYPYQTQTLEQLIDNIKRPSFFELVTLLMSQSEKVLTLTYFFIRIIGSAMFKDWKTTVIGIIGLLAYVVKTLFNIDVPAEVQTGFITVIVFLIGLFSKDSNK